MATVDLDLWRDIIERVLLEYASIPYSYGSVKKETVFDRKRDTCSAQVNQRYLIIILGWEGHRYEHGCTVHIDLIGDKIWIQRDGTEDGIVLDLEQSGIPKEHIVLGFKPPEVPPEMGYAIA